MSTFDRYRNISLSLKNVMFVVMYCLRLVLNGVSGGNQSVCRICILIEEMLERVESLDTLVHWIALEGTGLYWKVLEGVVMPVGLECHE